MTSGRRRAQLILLVFLATSIAARVMTFLIMTRKLPDLLIHIRGTHIHPLKYGIFLLVAAGDGCCSGHRGVSLARGLMRHWSRLD